MSERISNWLNWVFNSGVVVLTVILPFLVWDLTTDFYETPKFLLLALFVGVLLFLTALKFVVDGKVTITRTPLDLPLILLLVVAVISAVLSSSHWTSILGNAPRIHGGLASIVVYVLFYLILVNNLRGAKDTKLVMYLLLGVGTVLSIWSLLAYFGIKVLPLFPWTSAPNFTPTGASFTTTALLALILPYPLLTILRNSHPAAKIASLIAVTLFGITIALTGMLATYIISILALTMAVFITPPAQLKKGLPFLSVPILLVILVSVLSFIPPIGGRTNPLYNLAKDFPREIQLPLDTTWKVSISAFRDSPIWGTGPATYQFDFTSYKPAEFNNTIFWSLRFDQPFNEYLGLLATMGAGGLIALLLLALFFVNIALKRLTTKEGEQHHILNASLGISGILFFVVLAFHASTLLLWVVGVLLLASYMALNHDLSESLHLRIAAMRSSDLQLRFDLLPSVSLIIILVLIGFAFFFLGRFALADYHHRQGINAVSANKGLGAYNEFVQAEKLNPYNSLYRSNIAQVNFALANAIVASKVKNNEASPSSALSEDDKKNVQQLLSQAITEGRVAVALAPKNAGYWEILASIYRQITGVAQNALAFSLDSYGRAVLDDPVNPALRLNVGGVYYSVKNYDMAIRFFTDAANLKPDYANAYYNLSIALRDKGDLQDAQAIAEKLVSLLQKNPDSADYKLASDNLADIKKKVAEASKENTQVTGASTQTPTIKPENKPSALENKELPKVLDLPKPNSIATPPAVKKP